jgi:predicted DNA binding CopG/RHH family protein
MTTDAEAEALLAQDLSDLDWSQFKPMNFEVERKDGRVNMRLPQSLIDALKAKAKTRGIHYQRFIREALEHAVWDDERSRGRSFPRSGRHPQVHDE